MADTPAPEVDAEPSPAEAPEAAAGADPTTGSEGQEQEEPTPADAPPAAEAASGPAAEDEEERETKTYDMNDAFREVTRMISRSHSFSVRCQAVVKKVSDLQQFSKKGRMTRKWVDVEMELYNSRLTINHGSECKAYEISSGKEVVINESDEPSAEHVFTIEGKDISKTLSAPDKQTKDEWISCLRLAASLSAVDMSQLRSERLALVPIRRAGGWRDPAAACAACDFPPPPVSGKTKCGSCGVTVGGGFMSKKMTPCVICSDALCSDCAGDRALPGFLPQLGFSASKAPPAPHRVCQPCFDAIEHRNNDVTAMEDALATCDVPCIIKLLGETHYKTANTLYDGQAGTYHLPNCFGFVPDYQGESGNTPLICAVKTGATEHVKHLVETGGASVDITAGTTKETPVLTATKLAHEKSDMDAFEAIVDVLVKNRASLHAQNSAGESPLFFAATHGMVSMATVLTQKRDRARRDISDDLDAEHGPDAMSPLMEAARHGHLDVCRIYLDRGATIGLRDASARRALFYACEVDDSAHRQVVELLIARGAGVRDMSLKSENCLMEVAQRGGAELAAMLLEHGADASQARQGLTAHAMAEAAGHVDVCEVLECVDRAILSGDFVGLKRLIERGNYPVDWTVLRSRRRVTTSDATQDPADQEGSDSPSLLVTGLIRACEVSNTKAVESMLELGAEVDFAPNPDGQTPLMAAALSGHVDGAQLLVDKGAQVDKRNAEQLTSLMQAAQAGQASIVALLGDKCGADLNLSDSKGQTALALAAAAGHDDVVDTLITSGALVTTRNADGLSPLEQARSGGHQAVESKLNVMARSIGQSDFAAVCDLVRNKNFPIDFEACVPPGAAPEERNHGFFFSTAAEWLPGADFSCAEVAETAANDAHFTALAKAAYDGNVVMAVTLLQLGAAINHVSRSKQTALLALCDGVCQHPERPAIDSFLELADKLLASGAEIDSTGSDLMAMAVHHCELPLLKRTLALQAGELIVTENRFGKTPLEIAAESGDGETLQLLLDKGAFDIEKPHGNEHLTAVMIASRHGHCATINLLVAAGASIESVDHHKRTALMHAAEAGNLDVLTLLVSLMPDKAAVNHASATGVTALMESAHYGHESCVAFLLEAGAFVPAKDDTGRTARARAVDMGHKRVVRQLSAMENAITASDFATIRTLVEAGAYPIDYEGNGTTPFMKACTDQNTDAISSMLSLGADVNVAVGETGDRPVLFAVRIGNSEILDILLNYGANLNLQDKNGNGPLAEVILSTTLPRPAKLDLIRVLLEHHADVLNVNLEHNTPFMMAVQTGDADTVALFAHHHEEVEFDLDFRHFDDRISAIGAAARSGFAQIVRLLALTGANVNAMDSHGKTPLLHASQQDHVETVQVLLNEFNADVHLADHNSDTPMIAASKQGNLAVGVFATAELVSRHVVTLTDKLLASQQELLELKASAASAGGGGSASLVQQLKALDQKQLRGMSASECDKLETALQQALHQLTKHKGTSSSSSSSSSSGARSTFSNPIAAMGRVSLVGSSNSSRRSLSLNPSSRRPSASAAAAVSVVQEAPADMQRQTPPSSIPLTGLTPGSPPVDASTLRHVTAPSQAPAAATVTAVTAAPRQSTTSSAATPAAASQGDSVAAVRPSTSGAVTSGSTATAAPPVVSVAAVRPVSASEATAAQGAGTPAAVKVAAVTAVRKSTGSADVSSVGDATATAAASRRSTTAVASIRAGTTAPADLPTNLPPLPTMNPAPAAGNPTNDSAPPMAMFVKRQSPRSSSAASSPPSAESAL